MDKEIFETFYRKNLKKLVRVIRHKGISKEDAEDLAQDIFLELLKRYNDTYKENYFWNYLVKNRINDFLSKRAKEGVNMESKEFKEIKELMK